MVSKKEIVRLRQKKLSNGDISLYLDIYYQGKRSYEFLKIYLISKPRNEFDRAANKESLQLAQNIKAKRQLEVLNDNHGVYSSHKMNADFIEYFRAQHKKRVNNNTNPENFKATLNHFLKFIEVEKISFKEITEEIIQDFKTFLLRNLSQNSARTYYFVIGVILKSAAREGIINRNPFLNIKGISKEDTHREFLSLEELQKLAKTDSQDPLLKRAFLFSCLTGLRWSDIEKLKWSEISHSKNIGWHIQFKQKKTKEAETLPISNQAREILGEKSNPDDKIFMGLKYNGWTLIKLKQWVVKAGIPKNITFHSGRHTFATLQLSLGTDIYTVSKLLGHRELKTTQVYTKVIDKMKVDASKRIPNLKIKK